MLKHPKRNSTSSLAFKFGRANREIEEKSVRKSLFDELEARFGIPMCVLVGVKVPNWYSGSADARAWLWGGI
jgi:hypothetical protein